MDSTVEFFLQHAKDALINKDYDSAFEDMENAIRLENDNVHCWILVTEIFIAQKKFDDAYSSIITALNFNNVCAEAWNLQSRVFLGLLRYDEALESSKKALELDKDNAEYMELNRNINEFIKIRNNGLDNGTQEKTDTNPSLDSKTGSNSCSENKNNVDYRSAYNEKAPKFVFKPTQKVGVFKLSSTRNIKLFKQKKIKSYEYYSILDNFMNNSLKELPDDENLKIYSKIKNFTSIFAKITFNAEKEGWDGSYLCNVINVDPKFNTTHQISIFIHELAHHFLAEILELSLMYFFDSHKTDAIEAFVSYALSMNDDYIIMNEYCAHTVENHFMPYQHKNFGSFQKELKRFDLNSKNDIERINRAVKLGNTFAQDVIYMLEKYIDKEKRKEIHKQFLLDGHMFMIFPKNKFETKSILSEEEKLNKINNMFIETLIHLKTHSGYADLFAYKRKFKKNNN